MANPFRPNSLTIERRGGSGVDAAGTPTPGVTTVHAAIPARIGSRSLMGGASASEVVEIEGKSYIQDELAIVDGLSRAQYAGVAPGGTVVVNSITYTVTANGQGAFPDIRANDRGTDENAIRYLVLGVERYFVSRTLQVQLARGRAWA